MREHNEDHFLVGDLDTATARSTSPSRGSADGRRGPLLVVCDGMGGVEGGEVASELAAQVIWREMKATPATRDPEVFARLLRRATRVANHDVHAMAQARARPARDGHDACRRPASSAIGSSSPPSATRARTSCAPARSSRSRAISRCQSALLAAGHGAGRGGERAAGAILQALGVGDDVEPSLSIIELRRGDRVLLCSDGLHGLVGDPALALLMSEPHTVAEAVRLLVTAARAAGGSDNITAVVARGRRRSARSRRSTTTTCRRSASSIRRRRATPR